jgi:hypothetical protein
LLPRKASYRYIETRDVVEPQPGKEAGVRATYAGLIARLVLPTLADSRSP